MRKHFEEWYESHLMPMESDWFKREQGSTDYLQDSTQEAWEYYQSIMGYLASKGKLKDKVCANN